VNVGLNGKKNTVHATVDLNGDGVINSKDDALLALDINGDGILNGLDDVNGDGLLSVLDLGSGGAGLAGVGTIKLPSASANINLGTGGRKTKATVDLNGDGLLNGKDDVLVALDINGDGILSALDDVNADGILSTLDLGNIDIDVGGLPIGSIKVPDIGVKLPDIGGLVGGGSNGGGGRPPVFIPPPGGGEPPIGFNPGDGNAPKDIERVVGSLDNHDFLALKIRCADVLANQGSFDATTINVCRVLATR
jgi:hypothetical protein